jgi:hypothetical protein
MWARSSNDTDVAAREITFIAAFHIDCIGESLAGPSERVKFDIELAAESGIRTIGELSTEDQPTVGENLA